MRYRRLIALFSLIFLLAADTALAFSQDYTPDDPNLVYQTYFNLINVGPSWSKDIRVNKEVVVAVLDSGVDLDHPDLVENMWINNGEIASDGIDNDKNSYIDDVQGWNFVASNNDPQPHLSGDYDFVAINHGTIVAGIIAAADNLSGIVGIAPRVKIMPLKILDEKGVGNVLVLSQAIKYAVDNGADIINLSLVGKNSDKVLSDTIIEAYNKGVMIVAASGNEENTGINLDEDPRYPVCEIDEIDRILGVAAVDENKKITTFTNYGEQCIDISAPGTGFYSTIYYDSKVAEFNRYYSGGWSGTSVAAPTVAATAALIKMNFPDLKPYDIYSIIRASAQSLQKENPLNHQKLGAGLLNVGAALNQASVYYSQTTKIILAPEAGLPPEVLIMDNEGNLESSFLAYGANFKGGLNVATGDVDDDNRTDIITAPLAGGGPHIRIFSESGQLQGEFFAYDAKFTGGVNLAVGDVNNDGVTDIITAPLAGGGPHIRIFSESGQLQGEFFAYDAKFTGGVNLAVGDVNNDGVTDIVTAPRNNHSPEIKVFEISGRTISRFMAYDAAFKQGVNISVGDVNNDKWPEIVTVPAKGRAPELKTYSLKGRVKSEFVPYSKFLLTGIKISAADISGDGLPEILTLPNQGSTALLRVFDSAGLEKSSLYLRHPRDKNGYNFAILNH